MEKYNILLITTDQMRGDCLGILNHPDVKTPYLDSLALTGTIFKNAYTACPSCIAARAGLMTGLSPKNHGRVGYMDGVEWTYPNTLASTLSENGYYTQCVGKMHVHPPRNNLGFHNVTLHDGYLGYYRKPTTEHCYHQSVCDDYFYWLKCELGAKADVIDTGIECNSWVARPWIYEEKYHPTNWVVSESIDFLRKRDRSKPFFMHTSFVRPHPPFDAPSCYFDMYKDKDLTMPVIGDFSDKETYKTQGRHYCSSEGIADKELLNQALVGYYACITHVDHQIGRLFQAMQDDQCFNNTIIIFTSDHGELLGDHNTYRKTRPYEGSTNIPFIIKMPSDSDITPGTTKDAIVELSDILPTLVDLSNSSMDFKVDGKSLINILNNTSFDVREYLHGEHSGGNLGNHFIVTKTDKFIWFTQTGVKQYFDLENDPCECHNLIDDSGKQERVKYLENILIDELKDREEGYSDGVKLINKRPELATLSHIRK